MCKHNFEIDINQEIKYYKSTALVNELLYCYCTFRYPFDYQFFIFITMLLYMDEKDCCYELGFVRIDGSNSP